jgi:hypothetical protein
MDPIKTGKASAIAVYAGPMMKLCSNFNFCEGKQMQIDR